MIICWISSHDLPSIVIVSRSFPIYEPNSPFMICQARCEMGYSNANRHHANANLLVRKKRDLGQIYSPSRRMYSRMSLSVRMPTRRFCSSITTNRSTRDLRIVSKMVSRRSSMEQVYMPGKSLNILLVMNKSCTAYENLPRTAFVELLRP